MRKDSGFSCNLGCRERLRELPFEGSKRRGTVVRREVGATTSRGHRPGSVGADESNGLATEICEGQGRLVVLQENNACMFCQLTSLCHLA